METEAQRPAGPCCRPPGGRVFDHMTPQAPTRTSGSSSPLMALGEGSGPGKQQGHGHWRDPQPLAWSFPCCRFIHSVLLRACPPSRGQKVAKWESEPKSHATRGRDGVSPELTGCWPSRERRKDDETWVEMRKNVTCDSSRATPHPEPR